MNRKILAVLGACLAFALVSSSCGSDSDDGGAVEAIGSSSGSASGSGSESGSGSGDLNLNLDLKPPSQMAEWSEVRGRRSEVRGPRSTVCDPRTYTSASPCCMRI